MSDSTKNLPPEVDVKDQVFRWNIDQCDKENSDRVFSNIEKLVNLTLNTNDSISLYIRTGKISEASTLIFRCLIENKTICSLDLIKENDAFKLTFKFITDSYDMPFELSAPLNEVDLHNEHDIVIRLSKVKAEMIVDGMLFDEEWIIGMPEKYIISKILLGQHAIKKKGDCECKSLVNTFIVLNRWLTDSEIATLSDKLVHIEKQKAETALNRNTMLQYWRPWGHNTAVGDCMPFFHGERFHLFYLFDRRSHKSKRGFGAHQWAHVSSKDLINWEHHPLAIPITEEWEGSICTGSVIYDKSRFHCFYTVRMVNKSPAQISVISSNDGIHFGEKKLLTVLEEPYSAPPARDPVIFKDDSNNSYHMLVTTELTKWGISSRNGCLAHLVSKDLVSWEQREPFIVPGYTDQPECADYFQWNGWFYLVFSNNGIARYRMSKNRFGPWLKPRSDVLDCPKVRVPKTAGFHNNRRMCVGYLHDKSLYGGHVVFHELIQHEDGILGTKFPMEMIPASEVCVPLVFKSLAEDEISFGKNHVKIASIEGFSIVEVNEIPKNFRLTLRIMPEENSSSFGVCLRGADNYNHGIELRFKPNREKVGFFSTNEGSNVENEEFSIYNVTGLNNPFDLDVVIKEDVIDACIDNRRTLTKRTDVLQGNSLYFFVHNGTTVFENICIYQI